MLFAPCYLVIGTGRGLSGAAREARLNSCLNGESKPMAKPFSFAKKSLQKKSRRR